MVVVRVSRRAIVAALGCTLAIRAGAARAQALKPVIGFLVLPARVPASEPYFAAFERALSEAGFPPGGAVSIEYRYANNQADQHLLKLLNSALVGFLSWSMPF